MASAQDTWSRLHTWTEHDTLSPLSFTLASARKGNALIFISQATGTPSGLWSKLLFQAGRKSNFYRWSTPVNLHHELERTSQEAFMIQDSVWQTSTSLFRDKYKRSYDQGLLLNSWNSCHIATKATTAQQRSLDSLASVVLENRIALDYRLAEQGGATWITLLGKLKLDYIISQNKALALRRWLLPQGLFLIYLILMALGLGDQGFKAPCKHWGGPCLS